MGERRDHDTWDTGATNVAPAPPSERERAYLIVLVGDNLGEMHELVDREVIIGRAGHSTVDLRDDSVSRLHARVQHDGEALIIEDLGSRNGTFVNGVRIAAPTRLQGGDKIHVGHRTVLRFAYHDALDDAFQRQLYEAAMYDALTHAYSRRYFVDRLEAELQFAQRHDAPLALVLLDLDRLKVVNDRYGHSAGDRVLVEVAAAVQAHVRADDLFGRLGGDEFGVLCRGTALSTAASFAERVRCLVEELSIDLGGTVVQLTVSIGVAAFPEVQCESPRELVDVADRALYVAKAQGRNRATTQLEAEETRVRVGASPTLAPIEVVAEERATGSSV